MNLLKNRRGNKGLAAFAVAAACLLVSGCAMLPFGHDFGRHTAAASTGAATADTTATTSGGAPMPIEATYAPPATVPGAAAAPADATTASLPTTTPDAGAAAIGAPASNSTLLSPDEKQKVIAELEALAKKQGTELTVERAKAAAACDNLSADDLRKKMLQGEC
jgi:hypothetical protein